MINLSQEIIKRLKTHTDNGTSHSGNASYLGNTHFSYHISVPARRALVKDFLKSRALSKSECIALVDSLFRGRSHDEKIIASEILSRFADYRRSMPLAFLDAWLNHLEGWAEIDSLCQSVFKAEDLLARWGEWQALLVKFSRDKNLVKKRASLVFLTGPVSQSTDDRFSRLAFKNIETLKNEKNILITKAVSWLLRSLVKHHKNEVAEYLKREEKTLPKIALRETRKKLLTGKKN